MVSANSVCRVGPGCHIYEGAPSDVESLKHMKKINVSEACQI